MLRNGYDIVLDYANFGCREIRMRLRDGLPFPNNVWSKYVRSEGLHWTADETGKGGILVLDPRLEEAYGPVWGFDDYLDSTAMLREMLIAGDLRVYMCSGWPASFH